MGQITNPPVLGALNIPQVITTTVGGQIPLTLNSPTVTAALNIIGADIAAINVRATAPANRSVVSFTQGGAGSRVGLDGSNFAMADSANGDMVLTVIAGNSIRLGFSQSITHLQMNANGGIVIGNQPAAGDTLTVAPSIGTSALIATNAALGNGAGAGVGTLTNAPAAGNPTKWIPINDNGTIRNFPAW